MATLDLNTESAAKRLYAIGFFGDTDKLKARIKQLPKGPGYDRGYLQGLLDLRLFLEAANNEILRFETGRKGGDVIARDENPFNSIQRERSSSGDDGLG